MFTAVIVVSAYREYRRKRDTTTGWRRLRRAMAPRTTLTPHTIAVIRATTPVISRHVAEIANRFYEIFFTRHPEMRALFSLSRGLDDGERDPACRAVTVCPVRKNNSRKNVSGMQARAMAHTICAYTAQVADANSAGFEEVLRKIAHKHVSHHVTPDMYPLLGSCLLEAIFSVLDGVAANMDVVDAWTDAYWFLAETLMMEEDRIIDDMMQSGPGAWIGFKPFVVRKQIESESICSVYLTPEDDSLPLPMFQPGQYITLRIALPNGSVTHRNYSLSDAPGKKHFRISVKRVPGGEVSSFIHDVLRSGDRLSVSVPCGTFTLSKYFCLRDRNRFLLKDKDYKMPLVFISAGIGNTPFISMLNSIYEPSFASHEVFVESCPHAAPTATTDRGSSTTSVDVPTQATVGESIVPVDGTVSELAPMQGSMRTDDVLKLSAELSESLPILYFHAAKNKRHDAFYSHARDLHKKNHGCKVITVYSQPRAVVDIPGRDFQSHGHIDESLLRAYIANPRDTVFYICGPDHFTRAQYINILAIGGLTENILYERFAPGGFSDQLTSKSSL